MSSTAEGNSPKSAERRIAELLAPLPPGPVALAFSGGPDSLALALLAGRATERQLLLCNVEHNLRGPLEAAAERERLGELAAELRLPLIREELPPGSIAAGERGIEATARALRYAALGRMCEAQRVVALLTGHHRDDQVETILLELLHGAHITALGGIAEARELALPAGGRIALLRPLLSTPRRALRRVLESSGLEPITDRSNAELRYERNRLRARVLPEIAGANRDGEAGLLLTGKRLSTVGEETVRRAAALARRRVEGLLSIEAVPFFSQPSFVRSTLLEEEARRNGWSFPGRSMRFLSPLLAQKVPRRWLERSTRELILDSGGHRISLTRGRLLWQYDIVPYRDFRYLHEVDGTPFKLHWLKGWWPAEVTGEARRQWVVSLPSKAVLPPVVVRSRRAGDRLQIRGASRLIHSLYDRISLPQVVRENVPIIEDRNGILALPADLFGFPRLLRDGIEEGGDGGQALSIRFFAHGDFV